LLRGAACRLRQDLAHGKLAGDAASTGGSGATETPSPSRPGFTMSKDGHEAVSDRVIAKSAPKQAFTEFPWNIRLINQIDDQDERHD
jgi:hypothetical protein